MKKATMMRKILIGSALVLALSANAQQAELIPGEYEIKTDVTRVETPGTPDMSAEINKQLSQNRQRSCLTEATIAEMKLNRSKPPHKLNGCTVENRGTADHIDSTVSCTTPKVTTSVKGTLTHLKSVSKIETNSGEKAVMEMTTTLTRIGDCTG